MRHAGEEFLYVIEGELELHTEYYAPLILRAGESTYFDSRMGHAYIAHGKTPCRALSVCTLARPEDLQQPNFKPATSGSVDVNAGPNLAAQGKPTRRKPKLLRRA